MSPIFLEIWTFRGFGHAPQPPDAIIKTKYDITFGLIKQSVFKAEKSQNN
jgi:hypothetical protein